MRLLQQLLCVGALLMPFATFAADPAGAEPPKNDVHYRTLAQAQNTDAAGKIEVIEFFAYYCPHCATLEPRLAEWVKKQGDKIVFKRVHVGRQSGPGPQQKLFYTLDSLGLLPQYHDKVFDAIHQHHQHLDSSEQVLAWVTQAGIDPVKYSAASNSFGVQAKIRRAAGLMESYKIEFWPQIAIDGRYVTSPSQVGTASPALTTEPAQQDGALKVMDFLLAKAQAEKKR